jgi:hypothetical protein
MSCRYVTGLAAVPLVAGLMCNLSGCIGLAVMGAQHITRPSEDDEDQLAQMTIDGSTTKSELVGKLGAPLHEMNLGNVLIFGRQSRPRGLVQMVTTEKRDELHLIAVFNHAGVLQDHLWVGRKKAHRNAPLNAIERTD